MKQAFTGTNLTNLELKQLFDQLDINRDGEISYEEFLTGVNDKRLANSKAGRLLMQPSFGNQARFG